MRWVVCLVVSVVTVHVASAQLYHHDSYDGQDLDDGYYDEVPPPPSSRMPDALTMVRRYGDEDVQTLNPQDITDIKSALKALFLGRNVDFALKKSSSKHITKRSKRRVVTRSKFFDNAINSTDAQQTNTVLTPTRLLPSPSAEEEQDWFQERAVLREPTTTTTSHEATTIISTKNILTTVTTEAPPTTAGTSSTTQHPITTTPSNDLPTTVTTVTPGKDLLTTGSPTKDVAGTDTTSTLTKDITTDSTVVSTHSTSIDVTSTISTSTAADLTGTTLELMPTTVTTYFPTSKTTVSPKSSTRTMKTNKLTTTSRPTRPRFDIEALLAIVANMTYDYDTNLTQQLNETLQQFSIPSCGIPTSTTPSTTSQTSTEKWYNTTVVSKCFVCGMDTPGIPRNTFCADAFATDFLPLVPIDPRAKGHISRFRKYCRYFDVNNYQRNRSDPRAFLGRWTGGCAVRWVDLSGVYTQRTCRNRLRPTTGRHYGSKRMAKLELALANVDDGCVTSPMATLVPLSRGISLYARFHACVCTGNWCNRAVVVQHWIVCLWFILFVTVKVLR